MGTRFDCIVFGREPEGVEAHRVQYVVAIHAEEPAVDVGGRIPFRVSHMQARPGGIGEHIQYVHTLISGYVLILGHCKALVLFPVGLPLGFYFLEGVFAHGSNHTFASLISQRRQALPRGFHHQWLGKIPQLPSCSPSWR
ncbi:hypothetical protein SDC9_123783 [bioreactor metagenome]|uniref:Uncharacterized protein n=1 Tax=bioreactor metagenome TaxID=1076179 RepID=A0A645CIM5_9ZZZZ